jgi:hypothetical protein
MRYSSTTIDGFEAKKSEKWIFGMRLKKEMLSERRSCKKKRKERK